MARARDERAGEGGARTVRRRVRSYLPCEQVDRDGRKEFRMYHPGSGVRKS